MPHWVSWDLTIKSISFSRGCSLFSIGFCLLGFDTLLAMTRILHISSEKYWYSSNSSNYYTNYFCHYPGKRTPCTCFIVHNKVINCSFALYQRRPYTFLFVWVIYWIGIREVSLSCALLCSLSTNCHSNQHSNWTSFYSILFSNKLTEMGIFTFTILLITLRYCTQKPSIPFAAQHPYAHLMPERTAIRWRRWTWRTKMTLRALISFEIGTGTVCGQNFDKNEGQGIT